MVSVIEIAYGDIFEADADALVNPVNCVGVMGKGLAVQFKTNYPEMFEAYRSDCKHGVVQIGVVNVFKLGRAGRPYYIMNFPTKKHFRGKSQLGFVERGLASLVDEMARLQLSSVAMPALGCGLGGLDWDDVYPRIKRAFESTPHFRVILFEPND